MRSLCIASVALALVFMPGLYSTAYRATFPAFLCGFASSLFLLFCVILFVFSIFFVHRDDVVCWPLSCPFSSVCSPFSSPNVFPVSFGFVSSIL